MTTPRFSPATLDALARWATARSVTGNAALSVDCDPDAWRERNAAFDALCAAVDNDVRRTMEAL